MTDQGWMVDDDYDEDCWCIGHHTCWTWREPTARERRQWARRARQQRKAWRKVDRHANDRFWQARNRAAFDDEAPF